MNLENLWNTKLKGRSWQIKDEFLPFLQLCLDRNVKSVLEIGTYKGGTALAFLELGMNVLSVDLPPAQPEVKKLVAEYESFDLIEQDSKQLIVAEKFDLVFIDGDHSYEGVKSDYDRFGSCANNPGGMIAFHDIKNSQLHKKQNCQVPEFWLETRSKGFAHKEFLDRKEKWGGIGVIFL